MIGEEGVGGEEKHPNLFGNSVTVDTFHIFLDQGTCSLITDVVEKGYVTLHVLLLR